MYCNSVQVFDISTVDTPHHDLNTVVGVWRQKWVAGAE